MPELVAIAEEDGWAFVRSGGEWVVVRPPYQGWSKVKATESMVEQAICQHGFKSASGHFSDWDALIKHLKQEQLAAWKRRGETAFVGQEIEELIHELTAEELKEEFLDRVETELLPDGQWGAAERLLTALLGVRVVRQSDDLNARTVSLLGQCQEKKKNLFDAASRTKSFGRSLMFPHISPVLRPYANERARIGSLLACGN